MKKYIIIICFCVIPTLSLEAQVAVISNRAVSTSALTWENIVDIFTGNIQYWKDGTRITIVEIKNDCEVKRNFYDYLNLSYNEMKKIRLRKQFSGEIMPPITVNTESEMLDKVSSVPGAIGYLSSSSAGKSVKILKKVE